MLKFCLNIGQVVVHVNKEFILLKKLFFLIAYFDYYLFSESPGVRSQAWTTIEYHIGERS